LRKSQILLRGWLGGEPGADSGIEEMEDWSSSEEETEGGEEAEARAREEELRRKKRARKPKKPKPFEEDEYEDEIEGLSVTGIRNKLQTVQLCRLMVRATPQHTRSEEELFVASQIRFVGFNKSNLTDRRM
jgi:hypothetical protein